MIRKRTTLQAFRKSLFVTLVLTALLAACAPGQPSQVQIQSLVQTSVASTMQAQNQVGTFVAQTIQAQQPAATEADTPTVALTPTPFPTLTPVGLIIPTSTSASVSSGGGGGYVAPPPLAYSCDQIDWRPLDGTVFYPGEHFEVKWTLLNNGTQQWCEGSSCSGGPDLNFTSGTNFVAPATGPIQVPSLKPGKTYVVPVMSAVAPNKPGTYVMYWQLEDMQNSTCAYISIVVK